MTTWRKMISEALAKNGEAWGDVVDIAIADGELDREFNDGYGTSEGAPFTLWTSKNVYFPIVYDGAEWVGHAPRNPCDITMEHQGGQ